MIGRTWKHSNVWRRPVLIHRTNQPPVCAHKGANNTTNRTRTVRVHYAVLTQHTTMSRTTHIFEYWSPHAGRPGTHPKDVSVVDSGGETPGPIPNPEAKPARADGTAPGREWESRLPPTQQLQNTKTGTRPPSPHTGDRGRVPPFFVRAPTHATTGIHTARARSPTIIGGH